MTARAQGIAAIHALATWLADHPEVPIPTMVTAEHHVTPMEEADEWTRVAGVVSTLQRIGAAPYEGERTVQGDVDIALPATHGILIRYRVAAHKDQQPTNRYITREAGR